VAETSVPRVKIWETGGIMSGRGKGRGRLDMHGEVGEDIEVAVGQDGAPSDDLVIWV
jgi:hypothetical protein